ncbi:MAG: hypothetical protein PUB42_07335 [Firmicutes bacterium]|nr:hypothetical protein [Bacillota bacterium]
MAKKNTARRIFLTLLSVLLAVIILSAVLGYAVFNLYIAPKYRQITAQSGSEHSLSEKDLLSFAKFLTDKQFIDNLKNFDKESAKIILSTMYDLEAENAENPGNTEADAKVWDEAFTADMKPIETPSPTPPPKIKTPPADVKKAVEAAGYTPSASQKTAYDRITAAASEDEIAAGMAILSKISMSKINKLRAEGKNDELKAYIRSRLSSAEISTSLKLYNKYKHLL